jgi:hypothetical protein
MGVPAQPLRMGDLKSFYARYFNWYASVGRRHSHVTPDGGAKLLDAELLKQMDEENFSWNEAAWQDLAGTVRVLNAKGIKVLLFMAPIHPMVKEARATDPDGTSREGLAEVVRHLETLDEELPLVWFKDFNKGGQHDFGRDEFYDAGHLNGKGSERLTGRITEWMRATHAP